MPDFRTLAVLLAATSAVSAGCSSVEPAKSAPLLGVRAQLAANAPKKPGGLLPPVRVSKFVFYCDVPLDVNDPVFKELEELPDQIQRELRLPLGNNIVQVYLFETQDKYEAYMRDRFSWLPVRRAYFITDLKRPGGAEDLQVYTWLGEHLRTDLRHELTHALLNGVLSNVPLWLDEGLAGFFEQPLSADGLNTEHLEKLRRGPFTADLTRLEGLKKVEDMKTGEYREAWAWVHFMLRGDTRARQVLLDHLQQLRKAPNAGSLTTSLRTALGAEPAGVLYEHLARTPMAVAAQAR